MENCLFCRIIKGELGSVICETRRHVVIADITPVSLGHLLVIPKYHSAQMEGLPDEYLEECMVLIKKIVLQLGIPQYNLLQNNGHIQSVHHVHYHIIPYCEKTQEGLQVELKVSPTGKESLPTIIESYKEKLQVLNSK
ncbi:hypothetical protein NEIG_02237 [Nematocida sp. ERTm5]|nr:hypothetical protein NEIG_02237 [Nematocida sp. ERTm5]